MKCAFKGTRTCKRNAFFDVSRNSKTRGSDRIKNEKKEEKFTRQCQMTRIEGGRNVRDLHTGLCTARRGNEFWLM